MAIRSLSQLSCKLGTGVLREYFSSYVIRSHFNLHFPRLSQMDTTSRYLSNNLHPLQEKKQRNVFFFPIPSSCAVIFRLKETHWQAANTRQMMGAVEEAFKKWDITGDGAISKYELHAALTQLGMSEAQVGWNLAPGPFCLTGRLKCPPKKNKTFQC